MFEYWLGQIILMTEPKNEGTNMEEIIRRWIEEHAREIAITVIRAAVDAGFRFAQEHPAVMAAIVVAVVTWIILKWRGWRWKAKMLAEQRVTNQLLKELVSALKKEEEKK